jgi:hypothetical protein
LFVPLVMHICGEHWKHYCFLFMKGYHHDERNNFSIRAAEARQSKSGEPAATDPGQSPEARR